MNNHFTKVSKFLSYVLRHKPEAINLFLDSEGWANIQELLSKADINLTQKLLLEVVTTSDKKRFTISTDGLFIRANQGHSLEVDLGLKPVKPPEYLYHGTATRFLDSINKIGLTPKKRQYVHLSCNKETAIKVGQRHGKVVVLTIPALRMYEQGYIFFQAENGVWLSKKIPTEHIIELKNHSQ